MDWNPLWVSACALVIAASTGIANFIFTLRTERRRRTDRAELDELAAELARRQLEEFDKQGAARLQCYPSKSRTPGLGLLKLVNNGPSAAFNVNLEIAAGGHGQAIVADEIQRRFPIARLEVDIERSLSVMLGQPEFEPIWLVHISWDDERSERQEKQFQIDWITTEPQLSN